MIVNTSAPPTPPHKSQPTKFYHPEPESALSYADKSDEGEGRVTAVTSKGIDFLAPVGILKHIL